MGSKVKRKLFVFVQCLHGLLMLSFINWQDVGRKELFEQNHQFKNWISNDLSFDDF